MYRSRATLAIGATGSVPFPADDAADGLLLQGFGFYHAVSSCLQVDFTRCCNSFTQVLLRGRPIFLGPFQQKTPPTGCCFRDQGLKCRLQGLGFRV